MLKRKRSESPTSSETTPETTQSQISDLNDSSGSENCSSNVSTCTEPTKRSKRRKRVQFDSVTVFYFKRLQGFTCVPSQGGSTLGMSSQHENVSKFSLGEFAVEQERVHRELLREQIRMRRLQHKAMKEGSECSDEEEDNNTDDELENLNVHDYYFLQPVSTKKRRAILRSAGVKKIDASEKRDCKLIRYSREGCGCDCKVYCDPETCSCTLSGIKCQVDRLSFPCGCSKDGCGNLQGRVEFNPIRVRTHFIHTIMRLEMEAKQNGFDTTNHRENGSSCDEREEVMFQTVGENCGISNSNQIQNGYTESNGYAENHSIIQFGNDDQQNYNHLYTAEDTTYRIVERPSLYPGEENVQVKITSQRNDTLPRVIHFNDCDDENENMHSSYSVNLPTLNYNSSSSSSSGSSSSSSDESSSESCSQDGYSYDEGQNLEEATYHLQSPLELSGFDESANQEMCMVGSTSTHNYTDQSENTGPQYANLLSSSSSCIVTSQSPPCSNVGSFDEPVLSIASSVIAENTSYQNVSSSHASHIGSDSYNSGAVTSNYSANFTTLADDCANDIIYTSSAPSQGNVFVSCESTHNVTSSQSIYESSQSQGSFQSSQDVSEYTCISSHDSNVCSTQNEPKRVLFDSYSQEGASSGTNETCPSLATTQQSMCTGSNSVCEASETFSESLKTQENVCVPNSDVVTAPSQASVGSSEDSTTPNSNPLNENHLELVSTSSDICDSQISDEISSTKKATSENERVVSSDECSNTLLPIQNSDSDGDTATDSDFRQELDYIDDGLDHQNFGEAIKNSLIETVDVSV
ncbi:uncharacterized protein LOC144450856 [Glandiceps talaboti]